MNSANLANINEINEDELFQRVNIDEFESEHLAAEPYSYWKSVFRVFIKKPSAIIGLTSLILFIIAIIVIPIVAPEEFLLNHVDPGDLERVGIYKNMKPSWQHLFGTDAIGRDLFFCCFVGAKKSLILSTSKFDIISSKKVKYAITTVWLTGFSMLRK